MPAGRASIRTHIPNDCLKAVIERRPELRLELFPFGHRSLDLPVVLFRGVEHFFLEGGDVDDAQLPLHVGIRDELAEDVSLEIVFDVVAEPVAQRFALRGEELRIGACGHPSLK